MASEERKGLLCLLRLVSCGAPPDRREARPGGPQVAMRVARESDDCPAHLRLQETDTIRKQSAPGTSFALGFQRSTRCGLLLRRGQIALNVAPSTVPIQEG